MATGTDRLKSGFSLYCDILRILSALIVLLAHMTGIARGFLYRTYWLAHPAVIVFFVLSGFIIAYVSATRETSLVEYSAARLARLYSVAVPAIALTYILDTIGIAHDPSGYNLDNETFPLLRSISALLFLTQCWWKNLTPFSDDAYWSLSYEFWYYVLFGAALFLGGKARIIAVALAALIAGPRILMMLPVWLAGVAAYLALQVAPKESRARVLYVVSAAIVILGLFARISGALPVSESRYLPQFFSWANYIIGAGVALNLYAASNFEFTWLLRFKNIVRSAAGMTFSLYLIHMPVLNFVTAFLPRQISRPAHGLILIAAALIASILFSHFTENRKYILRNGFTILFHRRARI